MSYLSLYGFLLRLYTEQGIPQGDKIYLLNETTNVVYVFDYRVYYKEFCYFIPPQNPDQNQDAYLDVNKYQIFEIEEKMQHYNNMLGKNGVYDQNKIIAALRQPQAHYFNQANEVKEAGVNGQIRAIALLCEAIRFKTIHKALLRIPKVLSQEGVEYEEKWQDSWGTLALNWSKITNQRFTIPVPEQTVCNYIKTEAPEPIKNAFKKGINRYLHKEDRCRF